ncbi:MAG: hypothetical protein LBQ31_10865 [Bacteroidales bacterium]|nr:hypothetical protein [Bacteroidales bacterium]
MGIPCLPVVRVPVSKFYFVNEVLVTLGNAVRLTGQAGRAFRYNLFCPRAIPTHKPTRTTQRCKKGFPLQSLMRPHTLFNYELRITNYELREPTTVHTHKRHALTTTASAIILNSTF